jgi:hypothetical protein
VNLRQNGAELRKPNIDLEMTQGLLFVCIKVEDILLIMSMYEILQNKCDLRTYVFDIEIYILHTLSLINLFYYILQQFRLLNYNSQLNFNCLNDLTSILQKKKWF